MPSPHRSSSFLAVALVAAWSALPARAAGPDGKEVELQVVRVGSQPLSTHRAASYDLCRASCALDARCRSYSHDGWTSTCRTWADVGTPARAPGFVSGVRGGNASLTVAYANLAGYATQAGFTWQQRAQRLVNELQGSGEVPDVVLLTEVAGWSRSIVPLDAYEQVRAVHQALLVAFGIDYRIASATGVVAEVGLLRQNGAVFSSEVTLYNPSRLENLTPGDVATNFLVPHEGFRAYVLPTDPDVTLDARERGTHLRASLPACAAADPTLRAFVRTHLDGPDVIDANGCVSPSGPSWNYQYDSGTGVWQRVGQYTRLAFTFDPWKQPLDLYNVHLAQRVRAFSDFYPDITRSSAVLAAQFVGHSRGDRITHRYYPPIFANDINFSEGDAAGRAWLMSWLPGWEAAAWGPNDTMGLLTGVFASSTASSYERAWGVPITYPFTLANSVFLPAGVTNADFILDEKGTFGDHTANIVRFVPVEPALAEELGRRFELKDFDFGDPKQVEERFVPWCTADEACTKWLCLVDPKRCG